MKTKFYEKKIFNLRRSYEYGSLSFRNLPKNPFFLFSIWLKEAINMKMLDPTAMCLSTINHQGKPCQRMVLLKSFSEKGFIFCTNFNSRKAIHIKRNSNTSLLFYWNLLERQVIISGIAKKLSSKDHKKYFYNRPYDNQISTWISNQSKNINNRHILENKFFQFKKKNQEKNKIPFPTFWGAYRVSTYNIEFWQGRKNRLHDRFLYIRKRNNWKINRLSP